MVAMASARFWIKYTDESFDILIVSPSKSSDKDLTDDPLIIFTPFSVVNITALSIGVILSGLLQTSLLTGFAVVYATSPVPTCKAHIPSVVNTYKGNCPNCPCDNAAVTDAIPKISPLPTV